MGSNVILTDAVIAKEAMMEFQNTIGFLKGVRKQYSSEFARSGAQIGNTINVKKPKRWTVQQGPAIVPQGQTDETVPLTLNRFWTIPMSFSDVERTLHIEEFRKQYIVPAISKMASQMDLECHVAACTGLYPTANSLGSYACPGAGPINTVIGTPGTTIGTAGGSAAGLLQYNAPTAFLNAGLLLDNQCAPNDGNRHMVLNSAAHASSVASLSGLFNPQGLMAEQYRKGYLGDALGFQFAKDQNVYSFTSGTRAISGAETTTTVAWTAGATPSATMVFTAASGDNTKTLVPGDAFTVANVYAVNPDNQQNTGILYQFVVAEAVTLATGANNVVVSNPPKVVGPTTAYGTVAVVATSATAAVVFTTGAASTVSPQNMAFHESAFTLGTADLPIDMPNCRATRVSEEGISMRIVTGYDIMSSATITRLDVLGGFAVHRPEWAVRLAS